MASSSEKSTAAPQWAMQPFEDFLTHIGRLHLVLHLSMTGISSLRGIPGLMEALQITEFQGPHYSLSLEIARAEASCAQSEIDDDFPILHTQFTIASWAGLEATVRSFLARWLQN